MGVGSNGRLRFGDYEVDARSGKLFRNGWPVKIQPQPMRVLGILLEQPGEIVSREQLRMHVWGDTTFVEFDQGLNYCIRQIRLALRDGASEPRYIQTLPKQGYRFIAPVMPDSKAAETDAPATDKAVAQDTVDQRIASPASPVPLAQKRSAWMMAAVVCGVFATAGLAIYSSLHANRAEVEYTQLTDFTDSAVALLYRRTVGC